MMKTLFSFVFSLLTIPAAAETFHSDAFGVVPSAALSADRAAWRDADRRDSNADSSAETVLIYAGPKSLVAGTDALHVVALALDTFGNLVRDGTQAELQIGDRRVRGLYTRAGIADLSAQPSPTAGSFHASAQIQDRQSARATFRVAADIDSMTLRLRPFREPFSIETFATLSTTAFRDAFGNPVEDGIGAQIVLSHQDGATSLLPSVTLNGQAEARLLTRDLPGGGALRATLGRHVSSAEAVQLDRISTLASPTLRAWPVPEINAVALRVGPLETDAGHLLNDGAPIEVALQGSNGESTVAQGWVFNGHFETVFPIAAEAGPFQVFVTTGLGQFETSILPGTPPKTSLLRGAD